MQTPHTNQKKCRVTPPPENIKFSSRVSKKARAVSQKGIIYAYCIMTDRRISVGGRGPPKDEYGMTAREVQDKIVSLIAEYNNASDTDIYNKDELKNQILEYQMQLNRFGNHNNGGAKKNRKTKSKRKAKKMTKKMTKRKAKRKAKGNTKKRRR